MTQRQMEIADCVDELEVGQTIEVDGHYIKRVSPTRYSFDDERDELCFIGVCDRLK